MISSFNTLNSLILTLALVSSITASVIPITKKTASRHLAKRSKAGPWWFESYKPMSGAYEATLLEPKYILENMIYNEAKTVGTQETTLIEWKNDIVHWRNELDITRVPDTDNVPKSYAFVGMLPPDMNHKISEYQSIPVVYHWQRTNSALTKANVALDFVISNTAGQHSDHELMLWLEAEGGQKPIGYGGQTQRIDNLYGQSWTLYEGPNKDNNNIVVRTLVPDHDFDGYFAGDAREWLMKLVEVGRFSADAYVIVANMGMEAFWGKSLFEARSKMNFLCAGNNFQPNFIPDNFQLPAAGTRVPGF